MGTIKRVLAAGAVAAAFAIIGATTASAASMTEYGTDATAIEYGLASTGPDANADIVAGAYK